MTQMSGCLRACRGELADGNGQPVLLRGVGLGNWLLPEGYMWQFPSTGPQSPREIEAFITGLVGAERADQFWRGFRDRFITADDIARIAAEGMNHVRLPLNARLLLSEGGSPLDEGFELIDRMVRWCRDHGLWVVLDLHGAPGGQTGTNIDDSLGTPALFQNPANRDLTVRLWRFIAERYRDEPAVAGYDLLNEPLPNEYQHTYAAELVTLYRDLTAAIRQADGNHLIIYEGSHWATNWSMFTEVWDPNSMLQFHRYWSPPDRPGIQRFLDTRERLGLPIYMGEGGENNTDWLQTAFQLYEDYAISWNFWPWKKLRTRTSPCSVEPPAGWDAIVSYAANAGDRPAADAAWETLCELLGRFDISRCAWRPEVMSAIMRRVPSRAGALHLPATGFGFGGAGVSYQTSKAAPLPGFRTDDRVTILASSAHPAFDHTDGAPRGAHDQLLVSLGPGEWVAYSFTLGQETRLAATLALAGPARQASIAIDGAAVPLGADGHGELTGTTPAPVGAGDHVIRVTANHPGTQVSWLELTPAEAEIPPG